MPSLRHHCRHAIAAASLLMLAGCAAVADLNPLQREPEPLPPVQGNVIATSSSNTLSERLGTTDTVDPLAGTAEGETDPTGQ